MATISINAPGATGGFLYNNGNNNARLCITAETEEFDTDTIREWQDEGFDVVYLPLNEGGKDYASRLMGVKSGLGVGENYAVIGIAPFYLSCLVPNSHTSVQHSAKLPTTAWTTIRNLPMLAGCAHWWLIIQAISPTLANDFLSPSPS